MSKMEFVPKLAEAGGITRKQADQVYSAFVGMIAESLKNGQRVALPGIGIFSVIARKARTGRNPRTGEEIKIPARKAVKFSSSSVISSSLNEPKKAPQKAAKKGSAKPAKKK
ncbi:MAG: DNA-binding protein HU [Syntrophorhabdus sp. PtaB.Bin184]|nr:MAG: DNA-binding protein HU [Syntrophorhabdus sp. PtaB.Bin184]